MNDNQLLLEKFELLFSQIDEVQKASLVSELMKMLTISEKVSINWKLGRGNIVEKNIIRINISIKVNTTQNIGSQTFELTEIIERFIQNTSVTELQQLNVFLTDFLEDTHSTYELSFLPALPLTDEISAILFNINGKMTQKYIENELLVANS